MTAYQSFAQIYQQLMDQSLYQKWAEYVKKRLPKGANILELGTGAGDLGIRLARLGFRLTGLDNSEEMLTLAEQQMADQGVRFPLIQADMEELEDFPTYDGVISFCDSICYLSDAQAFEALFKEVYEHLNENGKFLFDVHSPQKLAEFDGVNYHTENDDHILLWDSYRGDEDLEIFHYLTILRRSATQSSDAPVWYERTDELHRQITFPHQKIIDMLKDAGFSEVTVTSDFKDIFDISDGRYFFEAKR